MKIRSKGAVKGSRDLFLEFWDPLYIWRTVEAFVLNLLHNRSHNMHAFYRAVGRMLHTETNSELIVH